MKIYLVTGESGEFSGWNTWPIIAFGNEDQANGWALLAEKYGSEHGSEPNPFDPNGSNRWDVCEYDVEEIELL